MDKKVEFVDIHCHILPGVDDGSENIEETKAMLQAAYDEGIRTMIATPHFDLDMNEQSWEELSGLLELVQKEAKKISEAFVIELGSELLYSKGTLEALREKKVPTMAGTQYVLVEFFPSDKESFIYKGLSEIINLGYAPILAHVERYDCLLFKEEKVKELIELGTYIQMNSRSLTGHSWSARTRYCRGLVKKGLVHFFGTDTHNISKRPPKMKTSAAILTKMVGEFRMNQLLEENGKKLVSGKYL